jgi:hypothetical protein
MLSKLPLQHHVLCCLTSSARIPKGSSICICATTQQQQQQQRQQQYSSQHKQYAKYAASNTKHIEAQDVSNTRTSHCCDDF